MTYEFLTNRREHYHFGVNVRLKLGKIDSKFFLNLFVYIKNFFCGTLLFALRTVTLIFFVCVVMEAIIKLYFIWLFIICLTFSFFWFFITSIADRQISTHFSLKYLQLIEFSIFLNIDFKSFLSESAFVEDNFDLDSISNFSNELLILFVTM